MSWVGSWLRYVARLRLAPFVPVPRSVGTTMLELAKLQPGKTVLDLGCGDGRLLVQAVTEFGAKRAVGYELDAELVVAARTAAGADARVDVRHEEALNSQAVGKGVVLSFPNVRLWEHSHLCTHVCDADSAAPIKPG